MFPLKFILNNETRRVQIPLTVGIKEITFDDLLRASKNIFPSLGIVDDGAISFLWSDDEGDQVSCSTDDEVTEAIRVMAEEKRTTFKFNISINNSSRGARRTPSSDVVHSNVTCDQCGVHPIRGIRYKCAVREDFDLCEACEALETPPHPMLKIYSPDQAPVAIMIAIREDEAQGGAQQGHEGFHKRFGRGWGHGGRRHCGGRGGGGHNFRQYFANAPSPPADANVGGGCGGGNASPQFPWGRCRWGGRGPRPTFEGASPFVQAMDAATAAHGFVDAASVLAGLMGERTTNGEETGPRNHSPSSVSATVAESQVSEEEALEQQVLEAVMRETATGIPVAVTEATPESATAAVAEDDAVAEDEEDEEEILQPPAAVFVADVTLPDGSKVQAGSVVQKIWRIRNSGPTSWPKDVSIVCCGGDLLFDKSSSALPVPAIASGEEVEVTLPVPVPEVAGRHVAYFRLSTKEGDLFGQRLWVDVRVAEDESSWQVVQDVPSAPPTASAPPAFFTPSAPPAPAVVVGIPVPRQLPSAPPSVSEDWRLQVWAKELTKLDEMGLTTLVSTDALLALLQKHCPRSSPAAAPSEAGIQRVVAEILN